MREQIQKLLDSDLSSLHIAKQTDVEQSTVYRLRKGERSLDKLGLSKAEKLYEFATILFNSEDDDKQNLLVKRASIMGMLQNLEMTNEESQKLEEELHGIEGKLNDINKMKIIKNLEENEIYLIVASYNIGAKLLFDDKKLKKEIQNWNDYFNKELESVKYSLPSVELAKEWLIDKDRKTIVRYLESFYSKS
ncbi:DNA-binding protein [Staphylococcus saprophyticus]|nr:DNA-binding protein [Staphylococcus saprophyticus]